MNFYSKRRFVLLFLLPTIFLLVSCKKNYIAYYQRVNKVDSIYRLANNPKLAVAEYKKLFRSYPPKNQDRIEEFETYIKLADQNNIDFGGKKTLLKLIPLIAPYEGKYMELRPLFNKYGISEQDANNEIEKWKMNLNEKLIDSFQIALKRDQEGRPMDTALVRKNVNKNAELLIWTFKNYGYPSSQKIGFFPMPTFLTHMNESKEYYPYFQKKLLEYIKSGDCNPRDYVMMVDSYNANHGKPSYYGFAAKENSLDTVVINRHRKDIGMPSLKHAAKIRKDFFEKLKLNNDNFIAE